MSRLLPFLLLPLALAFAGCDQIAKLDGSKAKEADAVAVGSACRQAGRAIEDCFNLNPDAPKASVFAGWKEMNEYMVSNKLDPVTPTVPRPEPKKKKDEDEEEEKDKHAEAPKKVAAAAPAAGGHAAPAAAQDPAAASAPGVPVIPATVNIPGLNTNTSAAPAAPAAPAPIIPGLPPATASAAPAAPAAAAGATPPGSISVGGQNIPISLPGAPSAASPGGAATPSKPGLPPAHH
jgi:hypothetical protein